MENDQLYHHGIKGMKWGIRRKSPKTSGVKSDIHDDYKKAHEQKNVASMSDAELRSRINRIQMEKQYASLSPTKINRGKAYAQSTIKGMTTVATLTGTAITLYNNVDKIKEIIEKAN